jgi:hypothetical protein
MSKRTFLEDPAVTPELLVVLAYCATACDDVVPQPKALARLASKGLGENVARRAVKLGKGLGYIPNLPAGEGSPVDRALFDGTLTVKELAALLYLRAITSKGRRVYARDLLEERFGWSPETIGTVMQPLLGRLRHRGQYAGVVYSMGAAMPAVARERQQERARAVAIERFRSAGGGPTTVQ